MMFSNLYTFINNNIKTFYYDSSDYFYKLSNFIFTLPWNYGGHYRYTPTNNGLLSKNSLNCKFTIAKLDNIQNRSTEELFIKVVNIESNQNDYIMIDVISAILFETIYNYIKNDSSTNRIPNIIDNHELVDFVNVFKYAFSSYSTPTTWNYNTLLLEKYTYPLVSSRPTSYDNKCNIYITNAINGTPIMIYDLVIEQFARNKQSIAIRQLINKYFIAIPHLYNFIYYYGYHFGFVHNDLHYGNILYDEYLDRLTIVDYGRNYFGFFYDAANDFENINNCVKNYYKILNYNNLQVRQINNYKEMIDSIGHKKGLKSLVKTDDNNGYLTHILDIITISITYYYYLHLLTILDGRRSIYFLKKKQISNLIFLSHDKNNKTINKYNQFINKNILINLKDTNILKTYIDTKYGMYLKIISNTANEDNIYLTYIYDGLFFTALIFVFFGIPTDYLYGNINQQSKIFMKAFQIIQTNSLITQNSINNFMKYLKVIHKKYPMLAKINTYFKKMDPQIISGGNDDNRQRQSSSSKSSSQSSQSSKDLNFELKELASKIKTNTAFSLEDIEPNHEYDIDINDEIMNKINSYMINQQSLRNPKMKEEENMETKMKAYEKIFKHNMQIRKLSE